MLEILESTLYGLTEAPVDLSIAHSVSNTKAGEPVPFPETPLNLLPIDGTNSPEVPVNPVINPSLGNPQFTQFNLESAIIPVSPEPSPANRSPLTESSNTPVVVPTIEIRQLQFTTDFNPVITRQNVSTAALPKLADLKGTFKTIELPNTIEFGDDGKVKFTVTNQGNAVARGPITVNLYISTDGNIDRNDNGVLINDALLASITKDIKLRPGQSKTFTFKYDNLTSVVAPGAYNLIAEIDPQNTIAERHETNNVVSQHVSAPGTDVVIDWNAIALNGIQEYGETTSGLPPTLGSRLLAIMSAAVYDTINAFEQTHTSYAVDALAPVGASIEAAAAAAAHRVLVELLPSQATLFNQQLVRSLIEITDNPVDEAAGVAFGRSVAEQILASRVGDGWDNNTPYMPPDGDYVWRPGPDGTTVGQNWGKVTPFGIPSVEQFSPDGLDGRPDTNPELYTQEIEEVRLLGGKSNTDVTTIVRTDDQTKIAIFWAYDRADTFRPYGQLNQITQEIAVREGNTLGENARLFAQLHIALADAAIVAWRAKYEEMQPRPDDVIAEGFAAKDGIEATVADPHWKPLLAPTPPFPDYISGHSTFGGAWAGVLTNFFDNPNYEFDAVSQELIGEIRHYDSFYDAAFDDAISRVYGGIHVREATVTDALPTGLAIGEFIAQNLFVPVADVIG